MRFFEYSVESFHNESIELAKMVAERGYRPDCVAYLAKGAWQIGKACAGYFRVPLVELTTHRTGEAAKVGAQRVLAALPRCVRYCLRRIELDRRLSCSGAGLQLKTVNLTNRFPFPLHARNVLLVDDAADSGSSLIAARGLLLELLENPTVKTAVVSSFLPARKAGAVDWSLHTDALLCTPMSKDNRQFALASALYEGFSQECMQQRRDMGCLGEC